MDALARSKTEVDFLERRYVRHEANSGLSAVGFYFFVDPQVTKAYYKCLYGFEIEL